ALNQSVDIISQDKKTYNYDIIEVETGNTNFSKGDIVQEGIPGYSIKIYRKIVDSQEERLELVSEDRYLSIPMKKLVD
ncbi:MAG: hypothetical protein JXC36_08930, partial [Candidatus Atribacteria bacterium]|nr:hypothetical protein [Candidatus Atribacteria bacterium]